MKIGVPALNVVISLLYILLAGLVAYWLKLSHKKQIETQQKSNPELLLPIKKEINFTKLFALSWFKKYSLVGACLNENRKFLVKQIFILSTYAVTCLNINKIILWPVAFVLFLLPLTFGFMEVAIKLVEKRMAEQEVKGRNQTVNNIHENEIQIEAVNIETKKTFRVQQVQQKSNEIQVLKERSIPELLSVSILTFITFILLYQTIFTLTNSVSNSGQLNIVSLIIILLIDQCAIRTSSGLITFGILKLLQRKEMITFTENNLVNWICQEQLTKKLIELLEERLRRELQNTASPLKHKQSTQHQFQHEQVKADCTSSQNNQCLNLVNLQPETLSLGENHQEDDPLQKQIYLTTPQKELFQGNQLEQSMKRSILHSIIDNKENETINNQLNKSTLKSHEQSKGLDDIISKQDDNMGDIQNFKTDFNLEHSRYQGKSNKRGKKKGAKRVLKLTGNSPYLQYLPNMLKNIDKVKNSQKDKKML